MPRKPRTAAQKLSHVKEERNRDVRNRAHILWVNRQWALNNPAKSKASKRRHHLRSKYDLTPAKWDTILAKDIEKAHQSERETMRGRPLGEC